MQEQTDREQTASEQTASEPTPNEQTPNEQKLAEKQQADQRQDWQDRANELAAQSLAAGSPTDWFDQLYTAGRDGAIDMPWDRRFPYPLLQEWVEQNQPGGTTAVQIGCGLGADANYLSGVGFRTTAFDISPTAIALARERFPDSAVDFQVASLFELPDRWTASFDLVVEIFTVQAMPRTVRAAATAAVSSLVAPGGQLLVITVIQPDGTPEPVEPPWPLTRDEIRAFSNTRLLEGTVDTVGTLWRADFRAS